MLIALRGYQSQQNVNDFRIFSNDTDVLEEQPIIEYHSAVLEANKYELANAYKTIWDEKLETCSMKSCKKEF